MNDQPTTIFAVTGYIGPNLMRGEWSTRRDDEDRTTAEYVLKSATDARLADAEAMAEALRELTEWLEACRSCGDWGNWDWTPDDEYSKAVAAREAWEAGK